MMSFLDQVNKVKQAESFFQKAKKLALGKSEAAVYVGTYGKYNQGSIEGKWLKLDDYASYDDFLKAALELHKDEEDPELMFQDFEGFPKRYYGESSIDADLWDWLALDEDDRELLEIYIDEVNDEKATIEQARDAFQGKYDSEEDWAANFIDDAGLSEESLRNYLTISDMDAHLVAVDMASSRAEDLRYEASKERYEDLFDAIDVNKEKYEEMQEKLDAEEDEDKQESLKKEIQKLAEKSIEEWESQIDEIESKIKRDPVGYFVDDQGIYSIEDLAKANFMQIDYEAYARDARLSGDVSFVRKDGEVWVFSNH